MANVTLDTSAGAEGGKRREKLFSAINRASGWLDALGFSWLVPLLKMAAPPAFEARALISTGLDDVACLAVADFTGDAFRLDITTALRFPPALGTRVLSPNCF